MKTIDQYTKGKENNFDFIRFVAATAVIFSHSFPLTYGDNQKELFFVLSNGQCTIGDMAVGIFFIISGFLIVQSYQRSNDLEGYFLSRAFRIFPALIAAIFLLALVIGPAISYFSLGNYFSNPATYTYLMKIFIFSYDNSLPGVFQNIPFSDNVNGSLWTLNYEMMCYIAVPAIALLFKRRWVQALSLLFAVIVITSNFFYAEYQMRLFLCSCFLFGAIFYLLRTKMILAWWIAFLALLFLIVSNKFGIFLLAFPLLAGYIIIYLSFVPRSPFFRFAKYGDFSYGIYIWAFPVQQIIAQHFSMRGNYFNATVSFPITLFLAIVSWHLIEKRALGLKKKLIKS